MELNHPYVRLARLTVTSLLQGKQLPESGIAVEPEAGFWDFSRACFVSIKKSNGDLRGCIGTILPVHPTLDREIISNAVAASTRDPRFPPMLEAETETVLFSVDVLTQPEPVRTLADLDPAVWGVIVSGDGRRGVLLPDLEGVDSVERQLGIATQKAGLRGLDGVTIERFRVERYKEA